MAKVIRFIFLLVFTSGRADRLDTGGECPFHKVSVVIDSTKKTNEGGFKTMRNIIYSILRVLGKSGLKNIYLSAKAYHSNSNCTWINETGSDYLPPTNQIKQKITSLGLVQSSDKFNKNCAEGNLFSQYSKFTQHPQESTAGILIATKASLNVSDNYVLFVYHNKTQKSKFRCIGDQDGSAIDNTAKTIKNFMCPPPPPPPKSTTTPVPTHPTTTNSPTTTSQHTTSNSSTHKPTTIARTSLKPTSVHHTTQLSSTTPKVTTKKPTTTTITTNLTTIKTTTVTTKPPTTNGTAPTSTNVPTTTPRPTQVPINQQIDHFIKDYTNISKDANDDAKIQRFMKGAVELFHCISVSVPGRENEKKIFTFKHFIETSLIHIGGNRQNNTDHNITQIDERGGMVLNRLNTSTFKGISYKHDTNTFTVPKNPIKKASALVVALVEYNTLPVMLQKGDNSSKPLAHDSFLLLIEDVSSSNVESYGSTSGGFQVSYTLKTPWSASSKFEYKCVFWEGNNADANWSGTGCEATLVKDTVVTCSCEYKSSRSYSVQREEKTTDKRFSLYASTYIGCGVAGGVCLVLVLMFLIFSRSLRKDQNVIHLNLAIALTLSNGLYVAADFVYKTRWLCVGVSIGIMFSYLATFFWIFVESLHLYMLVVRMRKDSNMTKYYTAIGWVAPSIFVAIAGAAKRVFFDRGETEQFCWLAYDLWPRWLFVGPSVVTITISVLLLFKTITASFKLQRSMAGVEKYQHVGKLVMVLIPIIGVARSSSLLAVGEKKDYFQYILTGCNGALSVLAIIAYCLLSPGVKSLSNNSSKYQQQTVKTSSGVTIGADNKTLGTDNKGKESSQLSLSVITEPAFHSKTNL